MKKVKNFMANIMIVLAASFVVTILIFIPFCAMAFSVANKDVLWLEFKKHDIELRLESESPVARTIAEMDAKWYNGTIATHQRYNKKMFISSFISDAVDALEPIEL